MLVLSRRSLGLRALAAMAFALLAVALGVVVAGCGSSGQETAPEPDAPAIDAPSGSVQESGDGGSQGNGERGSPVRADEHQDGDAQRTGSRPPSHAPTAAGERRADGGDPDPPKTRGAVAKAPAGCSPGLTRKECAARVRAQAESESSPSYPVSSPSDCVEAMGEERCREIAAAQQGASQNSGPSIDPETCLREYSDEYCAARFGEQYEQQQAASQAAG